VLGTGQNRLSVFQLATTIEEQELNAVMIQFNYGFFDFEKLSPFILELIGKGVSVFTDTALNRRPIR
jgi:hypothetical protein